MTWSTSDSGRLLFQRLRKVGCALGEVSGSLAQFVEQPRVLDGDNGLGGEVLHQLDLLVGERANFLPVQNDGADQLFIFQHRNGYKCPSTAQFNGRNNFRFAFWM